MNTLDTIFSRKSVREYSSQNISDETIHTILRAGMSGPSAVNMRPFHFLVVKDKKTLKNMSKANGPYAKPIESAAFGVLALADLNSTYKNAPEYWIIDLSIAVENMILAARDLGIGSVWLGTWPEQDRILNHKKLFNLPDNIIPHSLISFGYPKNCDDCIRDLYDESKVHFEKW
ncbi:MAG: nitroreductase family protein [Succinivibrio sp.]